MKRPDRAVGLSLVEVCGVAAVIGVVTAAALTLVPPWLDEAKQSADTTALLTVLRDTQQRAVTEGRVWCVDIDLSGRTWRSVRGACNPQHPAVAFSPDGTATPGTFRIGSDTVTVETSGYATVS